MVDLSQFSSQFPPGVLSAVQMVFAAKPDQEQSFLNNYGGQDLQGFIDSTVGWWNENGHQVAGKLDQYAPEMRLLDSLGYSPDPQAVQASGGTLPGSGPVEQQLGEYVIQAGQTDIANDAARQDYANGLLSQFAGAQAGVNQSIADLQPTTTVNTAGYFAQNPDVAQAFQSSADGPTPGTKIINGQPMTAEQYAAFHFQTYGQNEGRASPIQRNQSAMLTSELAASAAAQGRQTSALQEQLASLTASLSGNLAAKSANLQQMLASLTSANNSFTEEQKATLAKQVGEQFQNLNQEVEAKRGAISTELSTMGAGITAQDQARRAALETELTKLNAAQVPLNAARVAGANTLAAAVNLGAQAQQDQVRAQAAQAGYIGSSTGTDMAIARAAIGGRQQAAGALAEANIANAGDIASIGKYGAQKEYGIADNTAGQQQSLTNFGATENRGLTDYSATQRRGIGDFGTNTGAAIENNSSTNRLNLAGFGAKETRTLGDFGADATKSVTDYGAGELRNIKDSAAGRDLSFFSGDIQRRLATLNLPSQSIANQLQLAQTADEYGQSGLRRTMGNLAFFNTNGGNAPSTINAPTVQPVDNGYQNLGAGIISVAGNIGNANNWWSRPRSTPSGGTGFTTPNGNVGVQTNWNLTANG